MVLISLEAMTPFTVSELSILWVRSMMALMIFLVTPFFCWMIERSIALMACGMLIYFCTWRCVILMIISIRICVRSKYWRSFLQSGSCFLAIVPCTALELIFDPVVAVPFPCVVQSSSGIFPASLIASITCDLLGIFVLDTFSVFMNFLVIRYWCPRYGGSIFSRRRPNYGCCWVIITWLPSILLPRGFWLSFCICQLHNF